MVLDGKTIVARNYVTFGDDLYNTEEQIQPNGIDLRLDSVSHVSGKPILPAVGRIDPQAITITKIPPKEGWFNLHLLQGNYLVDFKETISVPDGYCAMIITRSSLVRCGVDVVSALWDTGFNGQLGASLRLKNQFAVQRGARLAQVVFWKSEFSGHRYTGAYQNAKTQVGIK